MAFPIIWTPVTICMVQDLNVEKVNTSPPLVTGVLWKGGNEIESL